MTCDTLGSFPSLEQMTEFEPNNGLFQSEITVSPDEAHTAAVCQSLEYIDIYDADMQLQKRLQGPQGIEPAIKTVKTEMGVFFGQDPLCLGRIHRRMRGRRKRSRRKDRHSAVVRLEGPPAEGLRIRIRYRVVRHGLGK